VLNVNDRTAGGAPSGEQIGNALFRVGIVSFSQSGAVKAFLHVDDE
jgi:hypothetical protein